MPEKRTFRDSVLRAIAVIGLVAILILGAWGIIQIVFGLPDFLSGLGGRFGSNPPTQTQTTSGTATEGLSLSAPTIAHTGEPLALSWNHANATGNYGYLVSYSCASGLTVEAPTPSGSSREVPCNTPFNFTNATQGMTLTPKLTGTKQADVTFFVAASRLSDGRITAVGSSTVSILPSNAQSGAAPGTSARTSSSYGSSTTRPAASYSPSGRTSNLYSYPDLASRIISAQPMNGRYSVQFVVENDGTNVAPYGWEFTAQLPSGYTYVSQPQQKLYPGDKIVYTLGFDMASYPQSGYPYTNPCNAAYTYNGYYNYPTGYNCGSYSYPNYYGSNYSFYNQGFSVTADPQNLIPELNKGNNTASVSLSY